MVVKELINTKHIYHSPTYTPTNSTAGDLDTWLSLSVTPYCTCTSDVTMVTIRSPIPDRDPMHTCKTLHSQDIIDLRILKGSFSYSGDVALTQVPAAEEGTE